MCKMSFYGGASQDLTYVEEATLLEDILLPELPPFPTWEEIHDNNVYYPRTVELYEDMEGKFSVPIITPLGDNTGEPVDDIAGAASARNIMNEGALQVSTYQESNYVTLNIPKYILLNFLEIVPKGTRFIVAFIGGSTNIGDIRVIGVSEYNAESVDE